MVTRETGREKVAYGNGHFEQALYPDSLSGSVGQQGLRRAHAWIDVIGFVGSIIWYYYRPIGHIYDSRGLMMCRGL